MMKLRQWFSENKETLGAIVLGVGMVIFSYKFGVPINGGGYHINTGNDAGSSTMIARNSDEAKILSLYETAIASSWDSDKRRIADDIYDIAGGAIEESTRTLAIFTLNEIAKKADWGSTKTAISRLIKEV